MVGVLAVEVFPVELDKTALADGLHGLLEISSVKLRVLRGQLLYREGHALFHRQADVKYVIRHLLVVLVRRVLQCGVDAEVFRRLRSDLVLAEKYGRPVGYFLTELCDLFVFCH